MKAYFDSIKRALPQKPPDSAGPSVFIRYGIALLCVACAFGVRYLLNPFLGFQAPYILFVPAIILAAWYGGLGPSILGIAAAFLLTNFFFVSPQFVWSSFHAPQAAALATHLFSAIAVVILVNTLRHAQSRVKFKAAELEKQTARLEEEIVQRERAEEQTLQREQQLRAVVNSSSAMIFLKDTEGRYLLSNRAFEAVAHRSSEEIIGKTDREIFPSEYAGIFRANDLKVIHTGSACDFEETSMHEDGLHTSIVHKYPLRDRSGKVYAVGSIVTDISQRKRWEEALNRAKENYENLVNCIDGIVWEADPDTLDLKFVSQKAERLLGYPAELWYTEDFWVKHLHPDDRDWAVRFCHARTKERKNHDFEYRMITANGRTVWLRDIVNVTIEKKQRGETPRRDGGYNRKKTCRGSSPRKRGKISLSLQQHPCHGALD